MADIIATKTIKGNQYKQRFSELAWARMGVNKNGWATESSQSITNSPTQKPSTGQKITNVLSDEPKKDDSQPIVDVNKEPASQPIVDVDAAKKAEFMSAIEGLNKGAIKDFFDRQDPIVGYSNTANLNTLKNQLGAHLNFDLVQLQEKFEG